MSKFTAALPYQPQKNKQIIHSYSCLDAVTPTPGLNTANIRRSNPMNLNVRTPQRDNPRYIRNSPVYPEYIPYVYRQYSTSTRLNRPMVHLPQSLHTRHKYLPSPSTV